MRRLLVATLLLFAGCATRGLPIEGGGGTGGGGTRGGGTVDMARAPDLGGAGSACTTACDCQSGLACFQGQCVQAGGFSVYCCESESCPAGNVCQSDSGGFGQCGSPSGGPGGGGWPGPGGGGGGGPGPGGPGGGWPDAGWPGGGGGGGGPGPGRPDAGFPLPDGGLGGLCAFVPCQANSDCAQLGCGACDPSGRCGAP